MISESPLTGKEHTYDSISRGVRELGDWFHNLDLRGVSTAPNHFLGDYPNQKWVRFAHAIPDDLQGRSVLDIGCNAGFYAFEMKRRGAGRVLGIDSDERYLAQARFAAEVLDMNIEFRLSSVYDVVHLEETFDVVLFMGVLYHLRYPLLALDLIREHVARDLLVFQSLQRGSKDVEEIKFDYPFSMKDVFDQRAFPKLHFVEHSYAGDPTNWWIPNGACAAALLRSAGFEILSHPEQEVYICRCAEFGHRLPVESTLSINTLKESASAPCRETNAQAGRGPLSCPNVKASNHD